MARHRSSVQQLAKEAGLETEAVLLVLMESGFSLETEHDVIPKGAVARARATLNLPRRPQATTQNEVARLARRAGMEEAEAREKLVRAGILRKRLLKRVPTGLIHRAELCLGLRQPPSGP